MAKPIPVDVKSASGLVYRVQVGAFSKPIPQDRFREFNPVSGETLNNGITRYMAGYFNNSKKVVEARDQIKQLGYKDAFAVAYCDGKRITLAEARILEANGQPVSNSVKQWFCNKNVINKSTDHEIELFEKLLEIPIVPDIRRYIDFDVCLYDFITKPIDFEPVNYQNRIDKLRSQGFSQLESEAIADQEVLDGQYLLWQ
jgi:hypothetical protein